jgi:hypothetical protein
MISVNSKISELCRKISRSNEISDIIKAVDELKGMKPVNGEAIFLTAVENNFQKGILPESDFKHRVKCWAEGVTRG